MGTTVRHASPGPLLLAPEPLQFGTPHVRHGTTWAVTIQTRPSSANARPTTTSPRRAATRASPNRANPTTCPGRRNKAHTNRPNTNPPASPTATNAAGGMVISTVSQMARTTTNGVPSRAAKRRPNMRLHIYRCRTRCLANSNFLRRHGQ